MREIKFRAWDASRSLMITSDMLSPRFISLDGNHMYIETERMECFGGGYDLKRQEFDSLMQFTGLKDANDVDVYDGDIVSISYDGEPETIHKVCWGGVEYPAFELNPELGAECNGFSEIHCAGDYELKVIGNIHQNPELLECKK